MAMPKKDGYGKEWKVVKSELGNNTRIYTRKCDFCYNYYEGRGAHFCSKSCATKWGRKNKDYSLAKFKSGKANPNGNGLAENKKKNLSKIMKKRWADGNFTGTTFNSKETKLELIIRLFLEKEQHKFKQKYWLNKKGWRAKEYDFYLPKLHLLIEVDGSYWHSLPKNVENDKYKDEFAKEMGYELLRIPEQKCIEDAVRAAIKDLQDKQKSTIQAVNT